MLLSELESKFLSPPYSSRSELSGECGQPNQIIYTFPTSFSGSGAFEEPERDNIFALKSFPRAIPNVHISPSCAALVIITEPEFIPYRAFKCSCT